MSGRKDNEVVKVRLKYRMMWLGLSRIAILVFIVLAVALVRYYRPSYETIDVVLMVAVGIILGALFVQSAEMWEKGYRRDLAKADAKDIRTKSNAAQRTPDHDEGRESLASTNA